jgi:hypothetical protein
MKVSDAIRTLQEFHEPNEELVIVWWDRLCFSHGSDDKLPTVKQWNEAVRRFESGDEFSDYVSEQCRDEIMSHVDDAVSEVAQ